MQLLSNSLISMNKWFVGCGKIKTLRASQKLPTSHTKTLSRPITRIPRLHKNIQIEPENAVRLINQQIYKIHENNKMHTPKTSEHFFKSPQANRDAHMRYSKLVDVMHPDPLVTLSWAESILGVIMPHCISLATKPHIVWMCDEIWSNVCLLCGRCISTWPNWTCFYQI